MRLTGFLLLAAVLHVSAAGRAQTVTYSARDVALPQVLAAIEQQTGYTFIYNDAALEGTRPVTVRLRGVPLKDALDAVLAGQPLGYDIEGKTVALVRKVVLPAAAEAAAPPGEVTGTVVDETGQPLAGATIKLKNGKILGLTDEKGNFKLKNVSATAIIEISYTGFGVTEVSVNRSSALKVVLKRANNKLDDVQVIAYGTTTERLNTGDVTTVTAKEIEEQPVSNPLAALEGRVPGLVVTQNTGAPGGSFTVQIRGQNSITNGNDPFYVIDGVPYSTETLGLENSTLQNGNPLNFINPADIESIEVLKDADATSIYGSRAANGAILITTKKGKAGKMKIDLNAYAGTGKATREMTLMNTQQYLQMRNEAFYNDSINYGDQPNISNAPDLLLWDTTRYTDWFKTLLGSPARYNDVQASVSGGNATTQYLVSGGYHRETSILPVLLPGQGADEKASVHFNLGSSSENKRFKLNLSGSYVSDQNTIQTNDPTETAYTLSPDAPAIYNPDGSLNWAPVTPGQTGTWTNPLAIFLQKYQGRTSNLVGNALISYALLPGLQLRTSLGYTNTQTDEIQTFPITSYDPGLDRMSGFGQYNTTNTHTWIIEPQADYRLNLGKGIFSALAGLTFHENNSSLQDILGSGYVSDALLENIQSASSIYTINSSSAQYKYSAGFGRLNYDWEDKYIINLSARRDGSSRFGPDKQFANFGAIGVAWIFSGEDFIRKNLSYLSFGKIRASYGTSGNDQIGDYRFLDLYTATQYPYQGIQGLYPQNLLNPDLAWEVDKKLEGGIELGFFKDRITLNASIFRNRSGNQLVNNPVSAVTGFTSIASNLPALVQNTGVEAVLNTIIIRGKNFGWRTSLNLTIPRNKLVAFPNLESSPYVNEFVVGQAITTRKYFHQIGVNDTTGIYQYTSLKGTPTYNPAFDVDNTVLVNTAPKFYGGLQNSFQWKGISLDILFQFTKQIGGNFFLNSYYMPGMMANQPTALFNRWRKPGDIKPYEQFSQDYSGQAYNAFGNYVYASDFSFSDASFIRLKNLSLSYDLPLNLTQKWHIQNIRIYLHGQNLLTITKYFGNDPENQGYLSPPLRVWAAGFQVTL